MAVPARGVGCVGQVGLRLPEHRGACGAGPGQRGARGHAGRRQGVRGRERRGRGRLGDGRLTAGPDRSGGPHLRRGSGLEHRGVRAAGPAGDGVQEGGARPREGVVRGAGLQRPARRGAVLAARSERRPGRCEGREGNPRRVLPTGRLHGGGRRALRRGDGGAVNGKGRGASTLRRSSPGRSRARWPRRSGGDSTAERSASWRR